MKLIPIHGAPATGKTTVAWALSRLTGVPTVEIHIAIDLARTVFGKQSTGFWELVQDVRLATLRAAVLERVRSLIMTAAYGHPDDPSLYEDNERAVERQDGGMALVHPSCSKATLMKRVVKPSRSLRGKLSTVDALTGHLARNNFLVLPRKACLRLSTEDTQPTDTAAAIAWHFHIPLSNDAMPDPW